jgi:hypothetical protein
MNCNIRIINPFPIIKGGQKVAFANAGEDYDGTKTSYGVVRFYVPDIEGKLYRIALKENDPDIKITMYV